MCRVVARRVVERRSVAERRRAVVSVQAASISMQTSLGLADAHVTMMMMILLLFLQNFINKS